MGILWCEEHNILNQAVYISGKLNVLADVLSRLSAIIPTEWALSFDVLKVVSGSQFSPLIDLISSWFYNRLPVYVSLVPDPTAWAVDVLSLS